MKITRIEVQNFIAARDIDIKVTAPILFVCGDNGQAKSTINDAILMAITKKHPRDVVKKKDFGMLLNDQTKAKAGGAAITIDGDADESFAFAIPKGDFKGPAINDSMRVALEGSRFAAMTPAERRTFLFALTKCKPNGTTVRPRLEAKGLNMAKVDEVLPNLLAKGFPGANEAAAAEATASKRLWKETVANDMEWGSTQAEGWTAEVPDLPQGDLAAMKTAAAGLDTALAKLQEELGSTKAAQQQAVTAVTQRAALEASTKRLPELEKQLADTTKEHAEFLVKVEAMRQRAQGKARVGLVHDMARFINGLRAAITTPEAAHKQAELLMLYAREFGDIDKAVTPDPEAVASLPAHENSLKVLARRIEDLQRQLTAAQVAKGQYDALKPADAAADHDTAIAGITADINETREAKLRLGNEIADYELAVKRRAEADDRTKKAGGHHKDVLEWLAIARALAPDGIPADILKDALAPVNEKLAIAADETGWPVLHVGEDMELTVGGRPYQMESESFRWRADLMAAQVVSEISGLKILLVDRLDVLAPQHRGNVFGWLDALAADGALDTAVIAGTLKSVPAAPFDSVQVVWLENGGVAGQAHKEAA